MEHTRPHRVSVNIGETVKKHLAILPNSFAAYPLIGCVKVGAYFGIGKVKAIKVLQTGYQFHIICNTDSDMGEIIKEVTSYIAACYIALQLDQETWSLMFFTEFGVQRW